MSEPRHILLGIRQRWAVEILGGRKVVEIRRGTKRWKRGDWLWLYAMDPSSFQRWRESHDGEHCASVPGGCIAAG